MRRSPNAYPCTWNVCARFAMLGMCLTLVVLAKQVYAVNDPIIDSLETLLQTAPEDSSKVLLLNKLCIRYNFNDVEKALDYCEQGIALSQKLAYQRGLSKSYNNSSVICRIKGDYKKSIDYAFESLAIDEANNNYRGMAITYTNIGNTYKLSGQLDKGVEYFEKSVALMVQHSTPNDVANSRIGLAGVYFSQRRHEEAMQELKQALKIKEELGDVKLVAYILGNMGTIQEDLKHYDQAMDYYQQSLEIRKDLNDVHGDGTIMGNMAKVFLSQGNYHKAIEFGNKSLDIAMQMKDVEGLQFNYKILSEAYAGAGQYQAAYRIQSLASQLKDSLDLVGGNEKLTEMEAKYQNEKKQRAIEQLEQEKELDRIKDERRNAIMGASAGVFILLVVLGYVLYNRQRLKQKLELEREIVELEQKALRLQMNPHFIFNSLNTIKGYLSAQNNAQAKNYLNKFAKMMRLTLEHSASKEVLIAQEIELLTLYLELVAIRFEDKFDFEIQFDGNDNEAESLAIPPMIVQPFVENAILHGIAPKEGKGHIEIKMEKGQGVLHCAIRDDGIGRDAAADLKVKSGTKRRSLGMQVTKERLDILNAKRNRHSNFHIADLQNDQGVATGTAVTFDLPTTDTWV